MKKIHQFLLVAGFVFLGCLIWKIGADRIWNKLAVLGWGGLALFVTFEFLAEGIHTVGWSYCLSAPYRRLPWLLRFRIRMAGNAVNYLTPTGGLGGEVTKAAMLSSSHQGPEAISGVIVGRVCSGMAHLILVAAGSMIVVCRANLPPAAWAAMFVSGGVVAAGIVAFLLIQRHGQLGALIRWLASLKFAGAALQNFARQLTNVDEALKIFYRDRPRDLFRAVLWQMLGHSIGLLQIACFFYLLHHPVTVEAIATVWILGLWFDLLTFAVPLNMGTLEGGRMVAFQAVGLGAPTGLTFGIALRLAQLSCACFGLVNYATFPAVWRSPGQRHHSLDDAARHTLKAGP